MGHAAAGRDAVGYLLPGLHQSSCDWSDIFCCVTSDLDLYIAFGLFLIVQQYNIVHANRTNTDTGGLLYRKAISQLFVGVYVMELYLALLFFLVRDNENRVACAGQGVVMMFTILCTAIFQALLSKAYDPLVKHLPDLYEHGEGPEKIAEGRRHRQRDWKFCDFLEITNNIVGQPACIGAGQWNQTVKGRDSAEVIDTVLNSAQPVVWLPRDSQGISAEQIKQTKGVDENILISHCNAKLTDEGRVVCIGEPPEDINTRA